MNESLTNRMPQVDKIQPYTKEIQELMRGAFVNDFSHYVCNVETYVNLKTSGHPLIDFNGQLLKFDGERVDLYEGVDDDCLLAIHHRSNGDDPCIRHSLKKNTNFINVSQYYG